MVDPAAATRFSYRSLFLALAAVILFVRLLPLSALPARFPGPDLILCLALAWVQRRPDYAPALLIVIVFLIEDILAMRPPGLWALIVLLGTEFLRSREALLRDLPFIVEWAATGALILAMAIVNWLVLALFLVPQADFGPVMLQVITTIVAYPLIVLATLFVLGVRRTATGEVDTLGRRI
ncbi:rod shape-determining protein MreD [Defluviimonas aestuarii]|uniref:rod shape-determining protein MreD n=1 Tax=Albidovulum aestuarii TaxID=1130726 RepID=UPI00249C5598|nr:rod shape-determining protein MreD [Defluviimonas aestuarii]MDI3335616.1 rod shape-determining protein MreD [Defluviimonas aestuarii]